MNGKHMTTEFRVLDEDRWKRIDPAHAVWYAGRGVQVQAREVVATEWAAFPASDEVRSSGWVN